MFDESPFFVPDDSVSIMDGTNEGNVSSPNNPPVNLQSNLFISTSVAGFNSALLLIASVTVLLLQLAVLFLFHCVGVPDAILLNYCRLP